MILVENLKKTYRTEKRDIHALKGITFDVRDGEIFGLLGPNGAGKTTTIKILTHLTLPDSGKVHVDGNDLSRNKEKIKKITGVVPQETNLERELNCRDNLRIQAAYYRLKDREKRIEHVLEEVDLIDRIDSPVGSLSGGMKRRLLLARALLTDPSVLYMDEPSIGLDPQVRIKMWEIIKRSVLNGRKVLLTTHYIEEAEALCDRVGILSKGELIACDSPNSLKSGFGEYVVEHIAPGGELRREIHSSRENARIAADHYTNSGSENVTVRLINLEDVFLELTGRRIE